MTNINIEIPDELHKKAKIQCAIDEKTLKEFIIEAIEEKLQQKKKK
jgi:predicted HicB family RNase H-like nuclease